MLPTCTAANKTAEKRRPCGDSAVGEQRQLDACDEFYIYVCYLIKFDLVAVFVGEQRQLDACDEFYNYV